MTRVKVFKTYAEQVELLRSRGMRIDNVERAEEMLARLNYYRLSGYWYPIRRFLRIPVRLAMSSLMELRLIWSSTYMSLMSGCGMLYSPNWIVLKWRSVPCLGIEALHN